MPTETATIEPTRDISKLAESLLVDAPQEEDERKAVAPEGASDEADGVVEVEEEVEAAQEAETATEDEDGEDEAEENSDGVLELAEDTVLSVTVDGQEVEVTLADLKKAYSGEGAIEKRLQAATEAKREADEAKRSVQAELSAGREKLVKAFKTFETMMFQPKAPRPDPSLQNTDPTKYLLALNAWKEDQEQVQQKRSQVQAALQAYEQQEQQRLDAERREHVQHLVQKVPELARPDTPEGKDKASLVTEAMKHYGFSAAEAAEAYDHRLYIMAMDAASYRRMMAASSNKQEAKPAAKVKVLHPGGSSRVNQLRKASSGDRAALERARQTGRVEDVAATLITNA